MAHTRAAIRGAVGLHRPYLPSGLHRAPRLLSRRSPRSATYDLLILATKSYDLEANIQQLRPIITPRTIILPLLNGADITDQIQALLPEARVWDGCVYISGRKLRRGRSS